MSGGISVEKLCGQFRSVANDLMYPRVVKKMSGEPVTGFCSTHTASCLQNNTKSCSATNIA